MISNFRRPRKGGILEALYSEINANLPEDERVVSLGCVPEMECGDGRWRTTDGRFVKKDVGCK